jgi:hypothetical protein
MIDYQKTLKFCVENELEFEELVLLYTIHIRNSNESPELHPLMQQYYNGKSNYDMIVSLEVRGFLTILRKDETKRKIKLNEILITEKFTDLLFIQPDTVWSEFYKRYPTVGIFGDGKGYFPAKTLAADDKEYFIREILKNADKFQADQIIKCVEEMFSYNIYTQKPEAYAKMGITKFMRNWDEIVKTHLETYHDVNARSWNRLLN